MNGKPELVIEAVELQRRVNRALRQTPDPWLGLNLTIAQLKTLFFISNRGSTNSRSLAEALAVTPSNVTGIIDRLVEHQLVSRQEDPKDRRALQLRVTDKGESILAGLRERRATHMSEILEQLTEKDLNRIIEGLTLLVKAAEQYEAGRE